MDRLELMRVFVRVVECKSFTRAADTIGVPRSTVSMAIKELEESVGSRLLNRTTRVVAPTADGLAFCDRCIRLIADYEEVFGLFTDSTARLRGTLRVNVPGRVGRLLLAPALPEFLQKHPDIKVEFGATDRVVDLHHEGIDCVVRVGDVNDTSVFARRLGDIDVINCASPAYLKANGTPRRPANLAQHTAVAYGSKSLGPIEPFEYVDSNGTQLVAMGARVMVDNAEMLIAFGLAGLGIIQVPAYDVAEHIARGELVEIMRRYRPAPMPLHILYPHHRQLSRRLQVFADWLATALGPCVSHPRRRVR